MHVIATKSWLVNVVFLILSFLGGSRLFQTLLNRWARRRRETKGSSLGQTTCLCRSNRRFGMDQCFRDSFTCFPTCLYAWISRLVYTTTLLHGFIYFHLWSLMWFKNLVYHILAKSPLAPHASIPWSYCSWLYPLSPFPKLGITCRLYNKTWHFWCKVVFLSKTQKYFLQERRPISPLTLLMLHPLLTLHTSTIAPSTPQIYKVLSV